MAPGKFSVCENTLVLYHFKKHLSAVTLLIPGLSRAPLIKGLICENIVALLRVYAF